MEFSSKNYQEANTDVIIKACGISKGSLYHYFANKKSFYLFLLSHSLSVFENASKKASAKTHEFYAILFESLEQKLNMYRTHPLEMAFLTAAAQEQSVEVTEDKNKLLRTSMEQLQKESLFVLKEAISCLPLKESAVPALVLKGLGLYIDAIRTAYLEQYRNNPYEFYENKDFIRQEIKSYVDQFLHGVVKGDTP